VYYRRLNVNRLLLLRRRVAMPSCTRALRISRTELPPQSINLIKVTILRLLTKVEYLDKLTAMLAKLAKLKVALYPYHGILAKLAILAVCLPNYCQTTSYGICPLTPREF